MKGTYTLVIALDEPTRIEVGALGAHTFPAGGYAYTGSAFGTGGFGRVDRHREVATGKRDVRHWHIDYLLGAPESRIVAVARAPGEDIECVVSEALPAGPVPGFGASDCDCDAHLAHRPDAVEMLDAVRAAYRGESV